MVGSMSSLPNLMGFNAFINFPGTSVLVPEQVVNDIQRRAYLARKYMSPERARRRPTMGVKTPKRPALFPWPTMYDEEHEKRARGIDVKMREAVKIMDFEGLGL